ncbi:hypothetical protein N0V85_007825 [Neurospora sp. IMI 360204]|nr:hypothetical protein N0V85_007825 [Neurospora sp. IMI 360204]
MGPFIEHGAELDNVLPGIPTMEEFIEHHFARILPGSDLQRVRQLKNDIMATIAERRRIMAAETLASSAASEQDKETVTQLDGSLATQADKKVDGNGKADTGNNPKPDKGDKVNLKAMQELLWWILLFVILALSIYMKSGFLSQADS